MTARFQHAMHLAERRRVRFVRRLSQHFKRENQVEEFGFERNIRDRRLRDPAESALADMLESRAGNIETIDRPGIFRAVVTKVEAGSASSVQDPQRGLAEFASGDRIGDFTHRRKPPIMFLELIEQLEILLVHQRELTSSVRDTAGNIRPCVRALPQSARALSSPW